jgi:hypothetical protein
MIGTCGPYNSGGSATHRIFIFQSSSIQITKINANSNLPRIFLLNRYNIRDPLRIPTWLNKTHLQELINFFFNSIINCRIESAGLLLIWPKSILDGELMLNKFSAQPWHLYIIPCKTINIFPKKRD